MQNTASDETNSCAGEFAILRPLLHASRFRLGTVILIMALSLYEVFIDAEVKVPARLQSYTFDDLKVNRVSAVVAVMALTFLGQVMSWDGERQLLGLGIAVGLVIAALNLYHWIVKGQRRS